MGIQCSGKHSKDFPKIEVPSNTHIERTLQIQKASVSALQSFDHMDADSQMASKPGK
jgi:hypothetical protein